MAKITFRNNKGFPPTICIQLLNWCNLRCINCRSSSDGYGKERLDIDSLSNLLVNISEYGPWRISLTGGEPFYWQSLPELLHLISSLEYPFSVTTNGYASKQMFDKISTTSWENGTLNVSIDGDRSTHDMLRGHDSFNKAVSFIKYCRPKAKTIFVNTVLFTDPHDWAEELHSILVDLEVDNWTIISPVAAGRRQYLKSPSRNFEKEYKLIRNVASLTDKKPTTSFLNFGEKEHVVNDVVFIDSNGKIKLPGFINAISDHCVMENTSIDSPLAGAVIYESVSNFLKNHGYLL